MHTHSEECQKRAAEDKKRQDAWFDAHPGMCRNCAGQGGFGSFGPADFQECSACVEKGLCPMCGKALPSTGEAHCSKACEEESERAPRPYDCDGYMCNGPPEYPW
mgnify:CR=1 FL=1